MIQQERFLRIIEYLQENRTATFSEIAKLNGVSTDTVRRDCASMGKSGLLRQVRGGVVFQPSAPSFPLQQPSTQYSPVQENGSLEMLPLINELVAEGQAIALGSDRISIEIARLLAENYNRLTVLTNSVDVIDILASAKGITLIVPSGILDPFENVILGTRCEQEILKYNVDIVFLPAYAFSAEKGITDYRVSHIGVFKALTEIARKVAVIVNHDNFEKIAYMNVLEIENIDILLTTNSIAAALHHMLLEKHITIMTPSHES